MGLVATWLNGIGLRSVVPTFEAAGIVSPAHLADLDVSYFESLGVTDPDDRRKLFYLVQRIKLAVNNTKDPSKMKSPTAEERVDAVISQNFVSKDERDIKSNSSKEAGHEFSEEKKVEAEPARRSKRVIAKKKKSSKASSKEDTDSDSDPSPSLLQKPGSMSRIKRTLDSNKKSKKDKDDTKKEKSSRSLAKKTGSSSEAQQKAKKEKVPKPPLSPTKNQTSPSKPPLSPTKQTSASISPSSSPSERGSKKKDKSPSSKATKERGSLTRTNSSSSIQSLPTKKNKVKSPSKKAAKERKKLTRTNSSSSIQSLPVSPSKRSPTKKISSSQKIDFSGEIQRSPSKRQIESKLPAAGKVGKKFVATSSRTLSSDTSDSTSTLGRDEIDEVRPTKSELPNSKSRRVTIAPGSDALGKTFQSSKKNQPKKEAVPLKEVKNKRGGSIPSLASSRPSKSMGVSESRLLQQYNQRRTSIARAPTATVAEQNQDQNVPSPSKKPIVTQGASGTSESWGTKISHLREDNDAEHELFRDQVGDASEYHEYYDMRIKVIVRKRPMSKSEAFSGGIDIIHPLDFGSYGKTLVYQPKTRVDLTKEVETVPFAYDNVFDESSTNIGIYNRSLRNLVEPFFEGQWATVFAYGQTGSGKTYTMMGSNITGVNAGTATLDESNLGLYYLAALDIFDMIKLPEYSHLNVRVSLFEIYGGKLFDLLNDRGQIKCLEDSKGKVCFPGLTEHPVDSPENVMNLIEQGAQNRSTGTTSRNADSSRSHAVLQIKLIKSSGRKKDIEHGRFSFIDLAGSERGADTSNASKTTRMEGAEINTSLLALKEVIRALATGGSMTHIPFRGSKLTQVLKDSFVGENSRCCMVACISPDIGNCEQTLNTLRYADRVKERNPETGVLPASCQQPTKVNSSQLLGISSSSPSNQQEAVNLKIEVENLPVIPDPTSSSKSNATEKQMAGQELISNHRSVMTRWLSMVKEEMAIVNQVEADRGDMDGYILQLQKVQMAQIDFLSELRGSLQKYVSAAERPHQIGVGQEDDDSFEDLRD